MKNQQSKDMDEVRSLLLKFQTIISSQSLVSVIPTTIRLVKDNGQSRTMQPKLTRVDFPKFNGEDQVN